MLHSETKILSVIDLRTNGVPDLQISAPCNDPEARGLIAMKSQTELKWPIVAMTEPTLIVTQNGLPEIKVQIGYRTRHRNARNAPCHHWKTKSSNG